MGPGFFLVHFQLEWSNPFRLLLHLTLVLSLGLGFRVSFSTALPPLMTENCLRLESTGWWYRHLVWVTFYFTFHRLIAAITF